MPNKRILLLFVLISLSFEAVSQPEILIYGQDKNQSFLLAHNGYLVYAMPRKAFAVQLTAGDNLIQVLSLPDSLLAEKMIKVPDGKHKYVVSKDRYGDLKLWYRGNYTQKPDSIALYKSKIDFPVVWVKPASPQKVLSRPQIISQKPVENDSTALAQRSPIEKLNENLEALFEARDTTLPKNDGVKTYKDSNIIQKIEPDIEIVRKSIDENEASKSDDIFQVLSRKEYEFDRLNASLEYIKNHPSNVETIAQITQLLKYDLTKIQFLKVAYQNTTEPQKFGELTQLFEFEASKNQLTEFIKSNPK